MSRAAVAMTATRSLSRSRELRAGALPGALAGLVGGVAFGASMVELGQLESIASLVRADTPVVGAVVHATVAAIVGAAFGLLMLHQRATAADMLAWGSAYGAFFWFVGPLTLRPFILGEPVLWEIQSAHAFFASLIGHIVWGAIAGLSLAVIRPLFGTAPAAVDASSEAPPLVEPRARLRTAAVGGIAGILSAALLTALVPGRNELTAPVAGTGSTPWLAVIALGLVTGALYSMLVPYSASPASPGLGTRVVQGITLGFLAWIVVALTIVPLDQIDTLAWTAPLARARFVVFPGYLLFGALTALGYCAIAGGGRFLFSDEIRHADRLTAGPQRLRAVARGALAGIIGGLLFTVVMVEVGALGRVSELVGAESPIAGFFVHMAIAVVIGGTYALLFRRLSFDVRSGLGWGVAYGLLWWILGALTLLPVLLGGEPQWAPSEAARAFPSLVGHLAYGMGLGAAFYFLEARFNPWWITRNEAERARARSRRDQTLTSAPALWAFVVFVAFFVVILLARGNG